MKGLRPSKIIDEEIKSMNVNDVGVINVPNYGQRNGIPLRSKEGNSDDFNAVNVVTIKQIFLLVEHSVERHDPYGVSVKDLRPGKLQNDSLKTANAGMELSDDVHDTHASVHIFVERAMRGLPSEMEVRFLERKHFPG